MKSDGSSPMSFVDTETTVDDDAPVTIRSRSTFFEESGPEEGLDYDIPEESGVYPARSNVELEANDFEANDFEAWAAAEVKAVESDLAADARGFDTTDELWTADCRALERRARAADEQPESATRVWQLAEARLLFGAPKGAADDCSRALAVDPSCHQAFEIRARARHILGDLVGALGDFNRAIRLHPRFHAALERRARLRLELGDPEGAIADLDVAIAIDSHSGALFRRRAEARLAANDQPGALNDLNVAVAIDPRDPESLHLRSTLREALGRSGATADRERAVLALARSLARFGR